MFGLSCSYRNSARCKIYFASKSCVLLYWQCYCTTARHWSCRRQPNVVVLGLVMAALRSRYGHYIGPVSFFFCFPPLISAVVDWMSTIVLNVVWPYSPTLECRSLEMQYPKIRYLGTVAQLCRAISSQLRHVSTKLCDGVQMANFCVLCFQ